MKLTEDKKCPICEAVWPENSMLLEYIDRQPSDVWHELECTKCKSRWDRWTEKLIFINYNGNRLKKNRKK